MDIFMGNIPKGTRPAEIKKLLKESIRTNIFRRLYDKLTDLGRFEQGVDIELHNQNGRRGAYRYGQIRFRSERLARLALDVLSDSHIRGNGLSVRAYVKRSATNDPRGKNNDPDGWGNENRRKKDRRKKHHSKKRH